MPFLRPVCKAGFDRVCDTDNVLSPAQGVLRGLTHGE